MTHLLERHMVVGARLDLDQMVADGRVGVTRGSPPILSSEGRYYRA